MKKLLDGCFILGKDLKKRINLTPAEGPMLLNAWGPQTAESTTEGPLFVNTVVICKQAVKHVHAHLSVCFHTDFIAWGFLSLFYRWQLFL